MKTYRRKEDVVGRDIAGEYLLVPLKGNLAELQAIFTLNPTGRCIWEALEEPKTRDEVSATLAERFDIGEEEAKDDFDEFMKTLVDEDLVREG